MNAEDKADAEEIERFIKQLRKRWHKAADRMEQDRLWRAIRVAEIQLQGLEAKAD